MSTFTDIESVYLHYDSSERKGISEGEIADAFQHLLLDEGTADWDRRKAEWIAFSATEDWQHITSWPGYFGPGIVFTTSDGRDHENPPFSELTERMVTYWRERGEASQNPLLKARYRGLVFDLSSHMTGEKASVEDMVRYVTALLDVVEERTCRLPYSNYTKLERALDLSVRYKNTALIQRSKDLLLDYESKTAEDLKPGTWGHSYDLLMENRGAQLSLPEKQSIIRELEGRFQRLAADNSYIRSFSALEKLTTCLGEYYAKEGDEAMILTLLNRVRDGVVDQLDGLDPMQASAWLERMERQYQYFKFKAEANEILGLSQDVWKRIPDSLTTVEFPRRVIPANELEGAITALFDADPITVLGRITIEGIPEKEDARVRLQQALANLPLYRMMPIKRYDGEGRVESFIGSLEDDPEGRLIDHLALEIAERHAVLDLIIRRGVVQGIITIDTVMGYLSNAPIPDSRVALIREAVTSFIQDQPTKFIYLIIPQIEETLRHTLKLAGGVLVKRGKDKKDPTLQLKTLDDLLREPILEELLTPSVAVYLRILLTDKRGLNLRNRALHGNMEPRELGYTTAIKIFQCLLCLGLLQKGSAADGDLNGD